MNTQETTQRLVKEGLDFPFFYTREGEVPFWDDPTAEVVRNIPKKYRPIYTLEGTLNLERRGLIDDHGTLLLKVLGDAVCANENQLRRYLSPFMSASQTSLRLQRYGSWGLVDRWNYSSQLHDKKATAPFTLGFGAYRYLKYFYSNQFFMDPERWDKHGVVAMQRYISMNELRCALAERKKLKGWNWQPVINNNPLLKRPMGAAVVDTPRGPINLLILRTQMGLDYLTFLIQIFEIWEQVYRTYQCFPLRGLPDNRSVVVIYASTRSFLEEIHRNLNMKKVSFPVWFCSEEDLTKELSTSFYISKNNRLQRIELDFLAE